MFTKGAGEYTVGVATVKENKTSAITSIKYTYAGSGQPATTKVSVTTTVAPVVTTVAPVITTVAPVTTPSVPGQDVDELAKPLKDLYGQEMQIYHIILHGLRQMRCRLI